VAEARVREKSTVLLSTLERELDTLEPMQRLPDGGGYGMDGDGALRAGPFLGPLRHRTCPFSFE
jgi:hypothetical protein